MIKIYNGNPGLGVSPELDAMHRDRKRVFVDLLKWDVPVIGDAYEVDQFDTEHAIYIVETRDREHMGSMRLLPTDRPHLLGALFPDLCEGPVPSGTAILEITRGCLSPRLRAAERLRARNRLISAATDYALQRGVSHFTCVADSGWLKQILSLGWDCRALGEQRRIAGVLTGALEISLSERTTDLLQAAGIYSKVTLSPLGPPARLAA